MFFTQKKTAVPSNVKSYDYPEIDSVNLRKVHLCNQANCGYEIAVENFSSKFIRCVNPACQRLQQVKRLKAVIQGTIEFLINENQTSLFCDSEVLKSFFKDVNTDNPECLEEEILVLDNIRIKYNSKEMKLIEIARLNPKNTEPSLLSEKMELVQHSPPDENNNND